MITSGETIRSMVVVIFDSKHGFERPFLARWELFVLLLVSTSQLGLPQALGAGRLGNQYTAGNGRKKC